MWRTITSLVAVALCLSVAGGALAAKKKNNNNSARNPLLKAAFGEKYAEAKLNPVQEQHLMVLVQKLAPEMQKAQEKLNNVYTKEQQEIRNRALQLAIRAKVNPKNYEKRVQEATATFELTAEQKQQMAEAKQEIAKLKAAAREASLQFLAPAQANVLFGNPPKPKKN